MNCMKCKKLTGLKEPLALKTLTKDQTVQCNTCGLAMKDAGLEYYSCIKCKNFRMCLDCKVCNRGHYLTRVFHLNLLNIGYNSGYGCDICAKNFKSFNDNGVWHCAPCNFDVCSKCIL